MSLSPVFGEPARSEESVAQLDLQGGRYFSFPNVAPGRYQVGSNCSSRGIVILGGDDGKVEFLLQPPGASITLRLQRRRAVRIHTTLPEGVDPKDSGAVWIWPRGKTRQSGLNLRSVAAGEVQDFAPGAYQVVLTYAERDLYIKTVTLDGRFSRPANVEIPALRSEQITEIEAAEHRAAAEGRTPAEPKVTPLEMELNLDTGSSLVFVPCSAGDAWSNRVARNNVGAVRGLATATCAGLTEAVQIEANKRVEVTDRHR